MTSPHAIVPPYEVVAAHLEPVASPDTHEHVSFMDTDDPDGGQTRWSVAQLIAAIQDGERFLISRGGVSGERLLEPRNCPTCGIATVSL